MFFSENVSRSDPESELSVLTTEGLDNALLRVANINKVLKDIGSFFQTTLLQRVDLSLVDSSALGRDGDETAAENMLELLLACAIQCERKSEYIHCILSLDQADQSVLMVLVQKVVGAGDRTGGNCCAS